MDNKKVYFTFQKSIINSNEFEILFKPDGKYGFYSFTDPEKLCNFFNINFNDYAEAASQYGGIVHDTTKSYILYRTVSFKTKKEIRKFIKEYLEHYITLAELM